MSWGQHGPGLEGLRGPRLSSHPFVYSLPVWSERCNAYRCTRCTFDRFRCDATKKGTSQSTDSLDVLAEGQGFEPWKGFRPCRFSRPGILPCFPLVYQNIASQGVTKLRCTRACSGRLPLVFRDLRLHRFARQEVVGGQGADLGDPLGAQVDRRGSSITVLQVGLHVELLVLGVGGVLGA